MKHETVVEILRVAKKLKDKPLLLNKLEEQGINKLRLVANIATQENQTMLAEKVGEMSKATLATFIQEKFRAGTELEQNNTIMGGTQIGFSGFTESDEPVQTKIPRRIAVTIPFEPKVELQLRELQKKLSRERKTPVELNEVIKTLLEIAAKMPKKFDEPVIARPNGTGQSNLPCVARPNCTHAKQPSRYISMKTKKILYQKYAGRCAWPGCVKLPAIFHHTLRFALNPTHNPDHIAPLCKNHERLAHHGLIENEEKSPENWRLRTATDRSAPKYQIDQKVISHYAPQVA